MFSLEKYAHNRKTSTTMSKQNRRLGNKKWLQIFQIENSVRSFLSTTENIHNDPALYIYGSQIPVVAESKFLGVIFDRKLSFIPHIKYVKAKCLKALNLLKVLSHTSWGADRTTLLHLYRSLIRSKLDYGSIIYGPARKSYLQMLDTVHNQGLRLALGAFRTSPVSSLNREADEQSLWLRREKLSLQYAIRLAANPSNPAFEVTFHHNFRNIMKENLTQLNPSAFV